MSKFEALLTWGRCFLERLDPLFGLEEFQEGLAVKAAAVLPFGVCFASSGELVQPTEVLLGRVDDAVGSVFCFFLT